MRQTRILAALAASAFFGLGIAAQAQAMRNPPGSSPLGSPTRNTAGQENRAREGSGSDLNPSAGSTRPPLGSDTVGPGGTASLNATAQGHQIGAGPNAPQGTNGTGAGGGAPNVLNPSGANGGTAPTGTGGLRPNGGAADNGSKGAPMQANGVRKVD